MDHDKKLGTVLLPRSCYDIHLATQLSTSFVELGFEDGILATQQVDFCK